MPQRPWTHVVDDPAARHLVVAHLVPKAADQPAALLTCLIEKLAPRGDFALLTRCEEAGPVVLCAFSHPDDAQSLATAVEAESDDFGDWASCRRFALDKPTAQAIADALAASTPAPELESTVTSPA